MDGAKGGPQYVVGRSCADAADRGGDGGCSAVDVCQRGGLPDPGGHGSACLSLGLCTSFFAKASDRGRGHSDRGDRPGCDPDRRQHCGGSDGFCQSDRSPVQLCDRTEHRLFCGAGVPGSCDSLLSVHGVSGLCDGRVSGTGDLHQTSDDLVSVLGASACGKHFSGTVSGRDPDRLGGGFDPRNLCHQSGKGLTGPGICDFVLRTAGSAWRAGNPVLSQGILSAQ